MLTLMGLALRLGYLLYAIGQPGFAWNDHDFYMRRAVGLTTSGTWRWSLRAVQHMEIFVKAPLYPVLLSFIAPLPNSRFVAGVTHAVAGALTVPLLFSIGRSIHSTRTGLIAAAVYACWLPSIVGVTVFAQENYYIPVTVAGFALLLGAMARDAPASRFAVAGLVFGIGALIRSMPVYYVPAAALGYFAGERNRTRARRAAILLVAFSATILPYVWYISTRLGRLVLIDNMGMYAVRYSSTVRDAMPPSIWSGIADILSDLVAEPLHVAARALERLQTLMHLGSGRWLEVDGLATTAAGAATLKIFAHLAGDLLFVFAATLAPIGFVLARRRPEALQLALWVAFNLGLVVVFRFSGGRYRSPVEPHLVVLAAVVFGGWRRPPRAGLGVAFAVSALLAGTILQSVPHTARGRAEYGIRRWAFKPGSRETRSAGTAGMNIAPVGGALEFRLLPAPRQGQPPPFRADIVIAGRPLVQIDLRDVQARHVVHAWQAGGLVYVEVRLADAAGRPVPFTLSTPSLAR